MRILFDHGTPSGIAKALAGLEVTEARERGWDRISNGELLKAAEEEGFALVLTTDKRNRLAELNAAKPTFILLMVISATRLRSSNENILISQNAGMVFFPH